MDEGALERAKKQALPNWGKSQFTVEHDQVSSLASATVSPYRHDYEFQPVPETPDEDESIDLPTEEKSTEEKSTEENSTDEKSEEKTDQEPELEFKEKPKNTKEDL